MLWSMKKYYHAQMLPPCTIESKVIEDALALNKDDNSLEPLMYSLHNNDHYHRQCVLKTILCTHETDLSSLIILLPSNHQRYPDNYHTQQYHNGSRNGIDLVER